MDGNWLWLGRFEKNEMFLQLALDLTLIAQLEQVD